MTGPHHVLQAGTKENTAKEVEMKEIDGPVLTALISFMYGRPIEHSDILLPLLVAADMLFLASQLHDKQRILNMMDDGR